MLSSDGQAKYAMLPAKRRRLYHNAKSTKRRKALADAIGNAIKARAAGMTAKRRSEIAKKAAASRWKSCFISISAGWHYNIRSGDVCVADCGSSLPENIKD
jgi:hypothetical protein